MEDHYSSFEASKSILLKISSHFHLFSVLYNKAFYAHTPY